MRKRTKRLQRQLKRGYENLTDGANGRLIAALAQLVEHLIRNEGVVGSSPIGGTISLQYSNILLYRVRINAARFCCIFYPAYTLEICLP